MGNAMQHAIVSFLFLVLLIIYFYLAGAAKCGDPFDRLSHNDSESLLVQGYTNPGRALEGDKINFTCISGMELIGPNSIICMASGEWEPNPREVECKGEGIHTTICNHLMCLYCDFSQLWSPFTF